MQQPQIIRSAAAALIASAAIAAACALWQNETSIGTEMQLQQRSIGRLEAQIASLEARAGAELDWPAVAAAVEPSVLTIITRFGLGSGWVAHSDARGSDVVTNFHVVAETWSAGTSTVEVRRKDQILKGTIVRVDQNNDLAVVHIGERVTVLSSASDRPRLGTTVMAVGSPLGLSGSVSIGVVSGFRSLAGGDYLQFSAPISPGNSGGPVVDSRGRVVAVTSSKFVGEGVEALSLAIPVQVACLSLVACTKAAVTASPG